MPGVSTTGSNSLGTVLVAGRKRVPSPAAGTTAVYGIGTSGRFIVHTLTSLRWMFPSYPPPEGYAVQRTKAQVRAEILAARRSVTPQIRGAEAEALAAHLSAVIDPGQTVCAYVPVGSEPGSLELIDALVARRCRRSPARRPPGFSGHSACRCSGDGIARASLSRHRSACVNPRRRGCPPTRWPTQPWCWCLPWPSIGTGCDWVEAPASMTGRCSLADPSARAGRRGA